MNEMNSTKEAYDQLATSYDAVRYHNKPQQHVDRLQQEFIRQRIKPGGRVLEIGCGTGRITRVLLETADSVAAVDISGGMLNVLRSKLGKPRNLQLIQSDIFNLRQHLAAAQFDTVVCLRTLPHVSDTGKALGVLADSMVSGGQALFDLWNAHSLIAYGRRLLGRKHKIPTFHQTYGQMLQLIDSSGLEIKYDMPLLILPNLGGISLAGLQLSIFKQYAYSIMFDTKKQT